MEPNYLVAQSNDLIEARHNNPLTAREQKIVLTMVSMIEPTDEAFKDYRISIKEFSEMLGLEGKAKYTEIKEIARQLMSKSIEIPQADGGWLLSNWVVSAEYIKGEGVIALNFAPKLMPYLLQLKKAFTSYRLSNILSLKSTYAIRLYELMKKWENVRKAVYTVDLIREKLGAMTKSYSIYGNFKNRVLLPAINELNESTDLSIKFKEIKVGRRVDRIEFTIQHMPEEELKLQPPQDARERLNDLANGYHFDLSYFSQMHQGATAIWDDRAEEELKFLIEYINIQGTKIENPLGFIRAKLKTAWEDHSEGATVTFATLGQKRNSGRPEMIPDWFKKDGDPEEPEEPKEVDPEVEKRRLELLEKLDKRRHT